MAKLSAHGREVGTIQRVDSAIRYMSDGKILRNRGFGWKLYNTVKAGVTPETAYQTALARFGQANAERPAFSAYRDAMVKACGLSKRWKLAMAIRAMFDDPDGVWADACDSLDRINLDVDEVGDLCRLYRAALTEFDSLVARGLIRGTALERPSA